MARYAYDRLSALDSSFLLMENAEGYMHVASTMTFEAGPVRTKDGGIDFESIRQATEAMLHLIPRYRQKIKWIPVANHPVWVDDPGFNINYHIRHTSLPHPGTERQLKRLSARIMSQHLDRSKPLWETWVVEGLEGDRFATISKTHHCMIDGVSGVDLMTILLSTTPGYEIPDPPPFFPRPTPSSRELLRDEILRTATLPFQAIRDLRAFAREADDLRAELALRARALRESAGWLRPRAETPLNEPIGSHRRFDWYTTEISDIRTVRKALGGSLNDVILATVAGAVRSFFERRQADPAKTPFRILAPVSTRTQDERGELGNRVAAWLLELPIGEPDPRERLLAISRRTAELKDSQQAVAAELLTRVADWTPSRLLSAGSRVASRRVPFNMVVTNVPGPQMPLYMLGAKCLESYPMVPLTGDLGLGIALFSYDGRIFWGFNADWELLPDLLDLVECIDGAFRELLEASRSRAQVRAVPEPVPVAEVQPAPELPSAEGQGSG